MYKFTALVTSFLLLIVNLTACNTQSDRIIEESDKSEYTFIAEPLRLPSDIGEINHLAYFNSKLFFCATEYTYNDNNRQYTFSSNIYSMNIDGTDVIRLVNYIPRVIKTDDDVNGGVGILQLYADENGYLWIIETGDFYNPVLSENFGSETDITVNHIDKSESETFIRKLDLTGAEVLFIDISDIIKQKTTFGIRSFIIDAFDNIYLNIMRLTHQNAVVFQEIFVLDSAGEVLLTQVTEGLNITFSRVPDGSIIYAGELVNEQGLYHRNLYAIDAVSKRTSEIIALPVNAAENNNMQIYTGHNKVSGYDVIINDNTAVYALSLNNEMPVKLFNWYDCNAAINNVQDLIMISDEEIICVSYIDGNSEQEVSMQVHILKKTLHLPDNNRTELIMVVINSESTYNWSRLVETYNKANPSYIISIVDYSAYNESGNDSAALEKLLLDIIAGFTPDIITINDNIPYATLVEHGWLEDLYPYINADPELDTDDFIEAVFHVTEINGGLYQTPSNFSVSTIFGNPAVVGDGYRWNTDEFISVLDSYPDADVPLGPRPQMTKLKFLINAVTADIDRYINSYNNTADFNNPDFVKLLELSNRFQDEHNQAEYPEFAERITTGRQIMMFGQLYSFSFLRIMKQEFNSDVICKGFPATSSSGIIININPWYDGLAIYTGSNNKDSAWNFIRQTLTEQWQMEYLLNSFATNMAAFNAGYQLALDTFLGSSDGAVLPELTQAEVDMMMELIEIATNNENTYIDELVMKPVYDIISDEAQDYYAGIINAEDAAVHVQSRISLYMSEGS